jgi:hypothetical protein
MSVPARPIRFASVDAAVAYLLGALSMLRLHIEEMESSGEDRRQPALYRSLKAWLALLEDPPLLRERLADLFGEPDGSVTFPTDFERLN